MHRGLSVSRLHQKKRLKHPQVFEARQLTVEAFKS
jgi:hypothetical protein